MLKNIRQSKNLSQSQLAAKADVSVRMIQKYEQGAKDLNAAKLETLLKLCTTLECTLCDLLSDPTLKELVSKYESQFKG